ncbi:unnamed protein product [Paramecium primaurelia]|uniref:malate dehydrogenase n=2 Tax=Paramecium TaxID=5884 RepID=A0A8S1UKJ0_9CILI|nr:unnamed protein product [Paramecium primaurelia]CAD8164683.1 unnamed protein product [Paramecium pentaurelia]
MQKFEELKIAITGAAGNLASAFYPLLGSGQVFGSTQKFSLQLLELPEKLQELEGIKMQIQDCAFPLLNNVIVSSDPTIAFKDADVAIFLGAMPRKPGMERSDLLQMNREIFIQQGQILNEQAKTTVKVLVVANPSNTNCATLAHQCTKIPQQNFTSLMQLDHNRCVSTLAREANTTIDQIKRVIIWGNHSLTQYPDMTHSIINGKQASETFSKDFLRNALIQQVQQRGGQILQLSRGASTISGAIAVKDHLRTWFLGTSQDNWTSFGVISDGNHYGIPKGICFSLPVTCKDFEFKVVGDVELDDFAKQRIQLSLVELQKEQQ